MHKAALLAKRDHVSGQIDAIKAQARIVMHIGGLTLASRDECLAFQTQRLAWIDALLALDDTGVSSRLADLRAELGAEVEALDTGDVRGLTPDDVALVCHAELCQIALGTHRSQIGDRP